MTVKAEEDTVEQTQTFTFDQNFKSGFAQMIVFLLLAEILLDTGVKSVNRTFINNTCK